MAFDLENFPTRETAKDMMTMISPIYDESYVAKWIFEVMSASLQLAQETIKGFREQEFPATVTWAIEYWEQAYGIESNPDLSIEERRAALITRRNYRGPMNPARIEAICEAICGREVELVENVAPHTFEIKILPGTSDADIQAIYDAVYDVKQSQKSFRIVFEVPVGIQIDIDTRKKVYKYRTAGKSKKAGRWPRPSTIGVISPAEIQIDPDATHYGVAYVPTGTRPDISTIGALRPVNIEADTEEELNQGFPYVPTGTKPDVSTIGALGSVEILADTEESRQSFSYIPAGTVPDANIRKPVNSIGKISAVTVQADVDETAAQDFPYLLSGTIPDANIRKPVNTVGKLTETGIQAETARSRKMYSYPVTGEEGSQSHQVSQKPSVIGHQSSLKAQTTIEDEAAEFPYTVAGIVPDVASTASLSDVPGIEADIASDSVDIVYKKCGAVKL